MTGSRRAGWSRSGDESQFQAGESQEISMIIFAQRPIGSKGDRSLRERESGEKQPQCKCPEEMCAWSGLEEAG